MKIKLRLIDVLLKIVMYASAISAVMILLLHMENDKILNTKALGLLFYICVIIIANALHNEAIRDYNDILDYNARLEDSLDKIRRVNERISEGNKPQSTLSEQYS